MQITFTKKTPPKKGTVVLPLWEGEKPPAGVSALGRGLKAALETAIKTAGFKGKTGDSIELIHPSGSSLERVIVCGAGKKGDFAPLAAERLGASLYKKWQKGHAKSLSLWLDGVTGSKLSENDIAARMGYGACLAAYRFNRYRTKEKRTEKPNLTKFTFLCEDPAAARQAFRDLEPILEGVTFTRDLVSEPANVLYPAEFATRLAALSDKGLKVTVIGEKELRKIGMNALLAVGQGSARESQVVILEWKGAGDPDKAPIAFVGKGVTFDSGGISLKPPAGMEQMKWDMGGAGTVGGLMLALAERNAKVNAIGIVGLVENMPSQEAQRPGDVVTSLSGQTVEVINTDAEGRLVLCDILWHVQETYTPSHIVDLATLTGAIIAALAHEYAGLFSNNQAFADQVKKAGEAEGEGVWQFPMGANYDKMLKSDIADMKNVGGRYAGSITAAQYLKRFIKNGTPWVHLDIAGMAWTEKDLPTCPKGGTGYGVRMLNRLVTDYFEDGAGEAKAEETA